MAAQIPNGALDPDRAAANLDAWCAQYLSPAAPTPGMVSATLPTHTATTREHTTLRYGRALDQRAQKGETIRPAEWACLDDLNSPVQDAAETENLPLSPPEP